jgi:tRNA (guanine37-N1)-methyltransferase
VLFSILTLFPEIFPNVINSSILGIAQKNKLIEVNYINIRDFSADKHWTVDDKPYGGGIGMIMKVDTIDKALIYTKELAKKKNKRNTYTEKTILLDPKGKLFNQKIASSLVKIDHLILICGHYEGVDARVEKLVDSTLSIGKFVLTGGEIPAMVVLDTVTRLVKGVLKSEATRNESYSNPNILECPQYTRPPIYKRMKVPKVLLSGNHKEITRWQNLHKKKCILSE